MQVVLKLAEAAEPGGQERHGLVDDGEYCPGPHITQALAFPKLKEPDAQKLQLVAVVVSATKVPAGHDVHTVAMAGLYEPSGHSRHATVVLGVNVPISQEEHALAGPVVYWPGWQDAQVCKSTENVPGKQAVQRVALAPLTQPTKHVSHNVVRPIMSEKVPGLHTVQLVAPPRRLYEPIVQDWQGNAVLGLYEPAWHCIHADTPPGL